MATGPLVRAAVTAVSHEKRHHSIFDLSPNFFVSCRLLSPSASSISETIASPEDSVSETLDGTDGHDEEDKSSRNGVGLTRWTCNTCKTEFESLQDQRSHFKSDLHRFNVKHLLLLTPHLASCISYLIIMQNKTRNHWNYHLRKLVSIRI